MVDNSLNPFNSPEEPKKSGGFFRHESAQKEAAPLSQELESTINRLRVLEERYTNVQLELRVTEENMIRRNKKQATDIKALTLDINELRKEINEIKDKVLMVIKELQSFAKKEDVKVMQRYLDMWEPMNFVTRKEINEIIDEKLAQQR